CRIGVESTVLDLTAERPTILRPGAITPEHLAPFLGAVRVHPAAAGVEHAASAEAAAEPVRSPGMKYRHYAPRTPCILYEGDAAAIARAVAQRVAQERAAGKRVAVLATAENAPAYDADVVYVAGRRAEPETVARELYRSLRRLDEAGVDLIIMEGVDPTGIGEAIMNRMRRAAGHRVVFVRRRSTRPQPGRRHRAPAPRPARMNSRALATCPHSPHCTSKSGRPSFIIASHSSAAYSTAPVSGFFRISRASLYTCRNSVRFALQTGHRNGSFMPPTSRTHFSYLGSDPARRPYAAARRG